ncbi:acetylglutamate kinase [Blattabacterium cuenoti]|uniref:acetylglutamate kinase n=1 Tax=Blattabacterium cuenoti TaxID=1653831 RepID=UPI00163C345C|nr:acetylglutamate kinase [Blattabacterium cuenoti]
MKIHIVKIGGNLINNHDSLYSALYAFLKIPDKKVLVHGGGSLANNICNKMGVNPTFVQGRRVTNKEILDIVVMTYAGLVNKKIVSKLQYYGCNALGLCGADLNCIKSHLRVKTTNEVDYGYVGDLNSQSVNYSVMIFLLRHNIVPVVCPITHNGIGNLLNTNADTIASSIAISLIKLYETELHFCFDKKGVLSNLQDSESFFPKIDLRLFQSLKKNKTVINGMIPKLENAFFALKNGVSKVYIGHPDYLNDIKNKTILCL